MADGILMRSAVIIDLDDCLFDSRHLGKYLPSRADDREGWDLFQSKYQDCEVNTHIRVLVDGLWNDNVFLLFVTGREGCPKLRELTEEHISNLYPNGYEIFYRPENDYRRAKDVKREIYYKHIKGKYNILFAIDDDIENIKMFYKEGINTLHCRYGKKER